MKKIVNKDRLYPERIQSLIKLVEENFSIKQLQRKLALKRFLLGMIPKVVVFVIVVWLFWNVFIMVLNYFWKLPWFHVGITEPLVITVSFMAVTIALLSYITKLVSGLASSLGEFPKEEAVNWNFKRLKERVEKKDIQLLKALIMMKCKQPEIDLQGIYRTDISMFTKKRLLEILYE